MGLSAKEAAKQVGMSKPGLIKAIRQGRISAEKDEKGEWKIEPSELFRIYPPVNTDQPTATPSVDSGLHNENKGLQAEIEGLRELVDTLKSERNDLRSRLDQEGQERRQLTAMLTDQRMQQGRKSLWQRIRG